MSKTIDKIMSSVAGAGLVLFINSADANAQINGTKFLQEPCAVSGRPQKLQIEGEVIENFRYTITIKSSSNIGQYSIKTDKGIVYLAENGRSSRQFPQVGEQVQVFLGDELQIDGRNMCVAKGAEDPNVYAGSANNNYVPRFKVVSFKKIE